MGNPYRLIQVNTSSYSTKTKFVQVKTSNENIQSDCSELWQGWGK